MYKLLDGVKVVELGHILLAPYAAQFLGDFGADVIKVEPPGGDLYRKVGHGRGPGMTAQWMAANRNKRSVALDLKQEAGRDVLRALLKDADIVVHNMRAQAMEGLGFGYDAVRAINPGIIYCAAIGFGQDGPYARQPAFDDIIQAYSGVAELNGRNAGVPAFVPLVITDMMAAMTLGQAMLAALVRKRATGEGCYVETPMFEVAAAFALNQHLNGHAFQPPEAGMGYPRVLSPHRRPVATADGHMVHGVYTHDHWRRLLAELGRSDVADGPLMQDPSAIGRNITELYRIAADEIFPTRSTADWLALLARLDIPCAPVLALEDLESDPHLQAVGMFEDYDHPTEGRVRQVRNPVTMHGPDKAADLPPPITGLHSREVLTALGLSAAEIDALIQSGAVVAP
ncbi:MAG: formyl-CoA transferase [Paracoccaceae bacterium]|jgi:formyl-CoA transferase